MNEDIRKRGRPPKGTHRGRPMTIYMSQPREALLKEAFELMCEHGLLPSTANLTRSRTEVIDRALDMLIDDLKKRRKIKAKARSISPT